jgi:hypothetical protein
LCNTRAIRDTAFSPDAESSTSSSSIALMREEI